MNNDINFITLQINETKSKIFDLIAQREDEEKKLSELKGALDTLHMIEMRRRQEEQTAVGAG